jgi:RiboL-PSP-HEPN
MPSASLRRWSTARHDDLDEIIGAHRSIGGTGRGRRSATQQINHAYAVLLSSQFQGFCRDLHSESIGYLVQGITPYTLRSSCRSILVQNRKLDKGNPNPGNIGSDYNPLGLIFWDEVKDLDLRNQSRQNRLEELNEWRNAIAHQDFSRFPTGSALRLQRVNSWRSACDQLAVAFDEVMRQHIETITGTTPW